MEGLPSEIQIDPQTIDLADWWAHSLLMKRRGEAMPAPLGVVRPRDEDEVALVVRWAAAQGVAIIPRGGGSGVCGGAGSRHGAIVLDLTALDRIVEIDATSGVVTAQAGVSGPVLESALNAEKLTLGHVPQSFHISTLGGWISTKAIG
ncbi:MAG TPA: FAD-dependent oxidoreductase, partial [Actinomycetota bacterium]|nr:FAD-dependent oxidoreductase [Actinomycetota bacterium]